VEQVDRAALARLVSSVSRFLDPATAVAAASGLEVEVLDSRRLGGAWTLDRVWERLGIGAAIRSAAGGRRLAAEAVERVIFALVAQRATRWVGERVAIEGCAGFNADFDADAAYAGMDSLLEPWTRSPPGSSTPPRPSAGIRSSYHPITSLAS
jgi:hypothetical protein